MPIHKNSQPLQRSTPKRETESSEQSPDTQITSAKRANFSIAFPPAVPNTACHPTTTGRHSERRNLSFFALPTPRTRRARTCFHLRLKKYSFSCIFLLHAESDLVFFNCELVKNSRYVDNERA